MTYISFDFNLIGIHPTLTLNTWYGISADVASIMFQSFAQSDGVTHFYWNYIWGHITEEMSFILDGLDYHYVNPMLEFWSPVTHKAHNSCTLDSNSTIAINNLSRIHPRKGVGYSVIRPQFLPL